MEVLEFLLDQPSPRGVDPAAFDNIVLRTAAKLPHGLRLVRRLCELPLSVGIDPAVHDNAPLRGAAAAYRVDVVRYLCELPRERGVDPSAKNNEALVAAAAGPGRTLLGGSVRVGALMDIVRYLCNLPADRGVDPSARDNHIIRHAMSNDQYEALVRFMCSLPPHCGVDPAAGGNQPLRRAVEAENESLVTFLLSFPAVRACPLPFCDVMTDLGRSMPRRVVAAASRAERRDSRLPLLLLASLCASGRASMTPLGAPTCRCVAQSPILIGVLLYGPCKTHLTSLWVEVCWDGPYGYPWPTPPTNPPTPMVSVFICRCKPTGRQGFVVAARRKVKLALRICMLSSHAALSVRRSEERRC